MSTEQIATVPEQTLSSTVVIRKSQNVIDVSLGGEQPLPDVVRRLLEPELQYKFIQRHYGADQWDPVSGHRRKLTVIPRQIFRYDGKGRLVTNFGFARRIHRILRQYGYQVQSMDLYPDAARERPDCYKVDWDQVTQHFQYRARQEECLRNITRSRCGLIHAVTGFGKMAMIAMTCLLYPRAKIYVVTKGKALVTKTQKYLTRYLPNVGQFGDGKKKWGQRITVFSADSLHHCDFDCDLLLADEGHLLITEESSKELVKFQKSRNFTFTATPTGRKDGTDKRLEALFGETIFYLPYPEAVSLGLVVPIRVEWTDVFMNVNPVEDIEDAVYRNRWGVWCNDVRNDKIAAKALSFEQEQVMILVDTVEHAVHLMKRLHPHGYTMVTDEIDPVELRAYERSGLLPKNTPRMTPILRESLREQFEAGTLRKVITTVWDTGIDPTHLEVLIRAKADVSEQAAQQEPGRACRINEETGKQVGIVCDFLDQFDKNFERRAKERKSVYKDMGWENVVTRNGATQKL